MKSEQTKPTIRLSGEVGNPFAIMGQVKKAINSHYEDRAVANKHFSDYQSEAMNGDYDHLIQTTMQYCNVL